MVKVESKAKENPKLAQRIMQDGRISLYLEYYLGRHSEMVVDDNGLPVLYESGKMAGTPKYKVVHNRRKENLDLYLIANPRTPAERHLNKVTIELAQKIRFERQQEFLENRDGYRLKKDKQINFLDYFQTYIDNYTKKDVRVLTMALNRFKKFLSETPEYKKYVKGILPEQIDRDMVLAFTEFLQAGSVGEGAKCIYQRFKKVINYAIDHDDMNKNPCKGISIAFDKNVLRKEWLSADEIKQLLAIHEPKQNQEIRRAFILSLYCGIRFCDVKDLTYANVDYSNRLLKFEQSKTKGHSSKSVVVLPLNDGLLSIIGEPKNNDKNELLFHLPSYTMCIKSLQRWVKHAGIEKHITWHCARHSFATNILNNGANIQTVAELLGHSGLKETAKYTRAVDELKQKAIDSLPSLEII